MITGDSINARFMRAFFRSRETVDDTLFDQLHENLFPDQESFENYLLADSTDSQIEHAKSILLRLSHDINPSPSNVFIYGLLNFETSLSSKTVAPGDFYPRDHFCHLVNLYLLGIYLFFHHKNLHRSLLKSSHSNNESEYSSSQKNDAAKRFLKSWKLFVIFHDIGYQFEALSPEESNFEEHSPYFRYWKNPGKYSDKDLALRLFSSIFSLRFCINSIAFSTFPKNYISLITGHDSSPQLTFNWNKPSKKIETNSLSEFSCIPDKECGRLNCSLAAFKSPQDLLIAAIDNSEDLSLLVSFDTSGAPSVVFSRDLNNESLSQLEGTIGFHESYQIIENIIRSSQNYLSVFFRNIESIDQTLKSCLGQSETRGDNDPVDVFQNVVEESISIGADHIDSDEEFLNIRFEIFHFLVGHFGYDIPNEISTSHYDPLDAQTKIAFRNAVDKMALAVNESEFLKSTLIFIEDRFGDALQEAKDKKPDLFSLEYQEIAALLFKIGWKNLKGFTDDLGVYIAEMHGDFYNDYHAAYSLFKSCREQAVPKLKSDGPGITYDSILQFNLSEHLRSRFSSLVESRMGFNLDKVLYDYKCSFIGGGRQDHGVSGSYLLLWLFDNMGGKRGLELFTPEQLNRKFFQDPEIANNIEHIFEIFFGVGLGDFSIEKTEASEEMILEVAFAIFSHNLYPAFFQNPSLKNYRTRRNSSMFAFFSILCDSLQPFGRKILVNQGTAQRFSVLPSSAFDLFVRKNRIVIKCRNIKNFSATEKRLRGSLASYIQNAHQLIKLELSD